MKLKRQWRWLALLVVSSAAIVITAVSSERRDFFTEVVPSSEIPASVALPSAVSEYPNIVSIIPEDEARDILLDIEDPVIVRFEKSVKDFYIDFRIEPAVSVVYENNPEKTEFRLLPKEPLGAGKEYLLHIYAKRRIAKDETYRKLSETTFTVMADRPTRWSADFGKRLEEARQYTRPLVIEGKYIDIHLENQILATFENGKLLDVYLISTGRRGMETPRGTFEIQNKARRPWSRTYGLFMPYWLAITADGKIGIHELPEWPGGYKEGASHLGTPVSHGCIRLGVGDAKRVWDWADIGTPVVVH